MRRFNLGKSWLKPDVTVVIRGVHERTETLCYNLLAQQVPKRAIHLIHESPFSQALKTSFEIGSKAGRAWTMVVDADVLVRPRLVAELLALAKRQPPDVFVVQTEMLDKFFGGRRVGGVKLYRTAKLAAAVKLVPAVDVRPETYVIKHMHKHGSYVYYTDLVCGLHDFEQYYRDIFRKGFTHGIKHSQLNTVLLPYWQRMAKSDRDFAVLLAGTKVGLKQSAELKLDKDEVAKECQAFLTSSAIREKAKIEGMLNIAEYMATYTPPAEYRQIKAAIDNMGRLKIPKGTAE